MPGGIRQWLHLGQCTNEMVRLQRYQKKNCLLSTESYFMKRVCIIFTFLLSILSAQSQDSWKVWLNNKLILTANKEDETANTIKIKQSAWKKNGNLEIRYKEAGPDTLLWHSFIFLDEEDSQLLSREKTLFVKISLYNLRKLFFNKKEIKIYTFVSPRNPNIAVRIRRVHLCTLKLP